MSEAIQCDNCLKIHDVDARPIFHLEKRVSVQLFGEHTEWDFCNEDCIREALEKGLIGVKR